MQFGGFFPGFGLHNLSLHLTHHYVFILNVFTLKYIWQVNSSLPAVIFPDRSKLPKATNASKKFFLSLIGA